MKMGWLGTLGFSMLLAACQSSQEPRGAAPAPEPAAPAAASGPEATCIAKVAATSGQAASIITVASVEQTLGGQMIMLNVVGSASPWRCSVDDRGVAEVAPAIAAPT